MPTVNQEILLLKQFCGHDQPRNFNTRKLNLHGDDQWISLRVQIHTPRDKCSIDDYSQQSLALLIPVNRLNARNSRPYCNRQPLKKILRIKWNRKNLTTRKFFTRILFNMKSSRSTVYKFGIRYFHNTWCPPRDLIHIHTQNFVVLRTWQRVLLLWVLLSPSFRGSKMGCHKM